MLERHIIQARARALAEKERIMQLAEVHVLDTFVKMPPGVYNLIPQVLICCSVCSTIYSLVFL